MKFDDCIKYAQWFEYEDIKVRVIHYNKLIESKLALNRDKDKLDIKNLKK